jgi:hypothetical protein
MTEGTPTIIKFYYEKGNEFRVSHVDGAIGGLTPTRDVFLAVYSQRTALPKVVEQQITPEGQLGTVVKTEGKQGIFREMEIGLVMTPEVAEQVAEFLLQHARAAQKSTPAPQRTPEKVQ